MLQENSHLFYLRCLIVFVALTSLSACSWQPENQLTQEQQTTASNQLLADQAAVHAQQLHRKHQQQQQLQQQLNASTQQIQQLQAENQQLRAKLNALTELEKSLHERKQRHNTSYSDTNSAATNATAENLPKANPNGSSISSSLPN